MTGAVAIRFFAAAAEAAGCDEAETAAGTGGQIRSALAESFGPELARVLAQCALVSGGRRVEDADAVKPGALVDALPPFAGG